MPRRRDLLAAAAALGIAGCVELSGGDSSDGAADGDGDGRDWNDGSGTDSGQRADGAGSGEDESGDGQAPTTEAFDRGPLTTGVIEAQEVTFVIPGETFFDDRFEQQTSVTIYGAEVAIDGAMWIDDESLSPSDPVELADATVFAPGDVWEQDLPDLEAELAGVDRRQSGRKRFPGSGFIDEDVHVFTGTDLDGALNDGVPESEVVALLEASSALYDDRLRDADGAFRERIESGYVFVTGSDYFPGTSTGRGETLFPAGTQIEPDQWVGGEVGDTESAAFPNGELIAGSFFTDRTAFLAGTGGLEAHLDDEQRSKYEAWLELLAEGGVLLPPGSWAEGTDPPGATPTPTATAEPTDDSPADPAFVPNPDVEGPGGDAVMSMTVEIDNPNGVETFEVDFDRVELHTADGDTVAVPAKVTVDFLEFEPGTTITVIFALDIPADTYAEIDFYMDPIEIVHEDDGDVTDLYEDPETLMIGTSDSDAEVDAGNGLRLFAGPDVDYNSDVSVRLDELSVGAMVTTGQSPVTNPDNFTNDDE